MKPTKKQLKTSGIQIAYFILVILVLISFSPIFYNQIIDLRTELDAWQSNIPNIDPETATDEELMQLSDSLQQNNIATKVIYFILTSTLFLAIISLLAATTYTLQIKVHKKIKFLPLFLKWIGINLAIIIFTILYFLFTTWLTTIFQWDSNTALTIFFWLFLITISYGIAKWFILFSQKINIKDLIKKLFRIHTPFLVGYGIILYVIKSLVEWSYEFTPIKKITIVILILLLFLLLQILIAIEKEFLVKK